MYYLSSKKVSIKILIILFFALVISYCVFISNVFAEDVPVETPQETEPVSSESSEPATDTTESGQTTESTEVEESTPSLSNTGGNSVSLDLGQEVEIATSTDTIIETDDANASTDIKNEVNTNNLDLGQGVETATSTNDNLADIENVSTTTAETGLNTASSTENVVISTGDSYAYANIINIANTNILNSSGFLLFLNQIFGIESFDLRDIFGSFGNDTSSSCTFLACDSEDVTFQNNNTTNISNDVIVRSGTGENSETTDGQGSIDTGDAYAAANILNISNTNIADSNYLMVVFNNFGDFGGDVVLPGADLFKELFNNQGSGLESVNSDTNNNASITNNTDTGAESGQNTATSTDGTASIETGNAIASTSVVNQVNQNIVGNDSFVILFRVFGKWNGSVLGAPQNVLWEQSLSGIKLYTAPGASEEGETLEVQNTGGGDSSLTASSTNDSNIENNVKVFALTGENKIESEGDASIQTGNAYAGTNIVNVANTNVIGRNWVLLIFNIFGDWFGNLSFGRQDLWIGGAVTSDDNPIRKGSNVTYHFTISNKGDSDATNVVIKNTFDPSLLTFPNAENLIAGAVEGLSDSIASWNLGTLKAGKTMEVAYTARVGDNIPFGEIPITVNATVASTGNDENVEDNTEVVAITALNPTDDNGSTTSKDSKEKKWTPPSDLRVSKSTNIATTTASSTVSYNISVKNYAGPAYNAVLVDVLKDEKGRIVNRKEWNLSTVRALESINVTYDVVFASSSAPGIYTNFAQIFAYNGFADPKQGSKISSNVASSTLKIIGGDVLGVTTCDIPYINGFLGRSLRNNPEDLTKLQTFLNASEGLGYVLSTGIFDTATERGVKEFQTKYREEILSPWKLVVPTGYVYLTTRKKINELQCGNTTAFNLTPDEEKIISRIK